jgi:hypothetical protein
MWNLEFGIRGRCQVGGAMESAGEKDVPDGCGKGGGEKGCEDQRIRKKRRGRREKAEVKRQK